MKLFTVALPVMLATPAGTSAHAPAEHSFASAASPAYEQQMLQGWPARRDDHRQPPAASAPTLAASFADTPPAAAPESVPAMLTVSPVPEPGGLAMTLAGLAAVLVLLNRRARRDG